MTASAMSQATMLPAGYAEWIADVKLRIRAAQQRAALAVNKEMLQLYWQIGRDILDRQAVAGWGDWRPRPDRSRPARRVPRDARLLADEPQVYAHVCRGLARPERNGSTIR